MGKWFPKIICYLAAPVLVWFPVIFLLWIASWFMLGPITFPLFHSQEYEVSFTLCFFAFNGGGVLGGAVTAITNDFYERHVGGLLEAGFIMLIVIIVAALFAAELMEVL